MKIQHNLFALNTNRQLGIHQGKYANTVEKLSTGYRINKAADDAAGLKISEKMRGQIRGLNRASKNVQDGISLIQTAEGALQESHAILHRMRELSVQAANDTNMDFDRSVIQDEIDQLTEEIDRIAYHTEFNNGIYPLLGSTNNVLNEYLEEVTYTFTAKNTFTLDDVKYKPGDSVTVTGVMVNNAPNEKSRSIFLFDTTYYQVPYHNEYMKELLQESTIQHYDTPNHTGFSIKIKDFGIDDEGLLYYHRYYGNHKIVTYISLFGQTVKEDPSVIKIDFHTKNNTGTVSNLWIQAGANANQGIYLSTVDATAEGIGIQNISVMSNTQAGEAILTIDQAMSKISEYRSGFGVEQNRLEHTMAVNDNTSENLQTAESKIRDEDMADAMVEHSKHNIFAEIGRTILAQANQSSQGVLALLQ